MKAKEQFNTMLWKKFINKYKFINGYKWTKSIDIFSKQILAIPVH